MRIVSLLPGATEMVCALGLQESLVGVSHECDFPDGVESLPKVTASKISEKTSSIEIDQTVRDSVAEDNGIYDIDSDLIRRLRPDVIVTQSLCNVCAVSDRDLQDAISSLETSPKIITLNPNRLHDVLDGIREFGRVVGEPDRSARLINDLESRIRLVKNRTDKIASRPSVIALEWIDPPFSAGHWNPEIVGLAGGDELIGKSGMRSQSIDWDDVVSLSPDVLLVACCGFTVERAMQEFGILSDRQGWDSLPCVKSGRVYVFDGSAYFNRPGPRLVDTLEMVAHTLHPEVHPLPEGLAKATQPISTPPKC